MALVINIWEIGVSAEPTRGCNKYFQSSYIWFWVNLNYYLNRSDELSQPPLSKEVEQPEIISGSVFATWEPVGQESEAFLLVLGKSEFNWSVSQRSLGALGQIPILLHKTNKTAAKIKMRPPCVYSHEFLIFLTGFSSIAIANKKRPPQKKLP